MKKILLLFSIFSLIQLKSQHRIYNTSRSFLFWRPAYQNIAATQSIWNNTVHFKSGPNRAALQILGLAQKSLCTPRMAQYFLPHCQTKISIVGDNADAKAVEKRDVRAEWINLPNDFVGTLAFSPEQEQATIVAEYNQDLKNLFEHRFFKHLWYDIFVPVMVVKNKLNATQTIESNTTFTSYDQPNTVLEAFDQPNWCAGKINPKCEMQKWGLGEIRVAIGSTLIQKYNVHLGTYSCLVIPTEKKQSPKYIFNPYIGVNGHWGIGSGIRFELPIFHDDCSTQLQFFLRGEAIFFIKNKQYRTLDLKVTPPICSLAGCPSPLPSDCSTYNLNVMEQLPEYQDKYITNQDKQWSRYVQLRQKGQIDTVPGVNILTQHVRVSPYGNIDMSTGFRIEHSDFQIEVGYNIWARCAERLELIAPKCEGTSFNFATYGIAGSAPGSSASKSTISYQAPDDEEFVCLKPYNLSLVSGTYPGAGVQRVHGTIGYASTEWTRNLFISIGGFYEVPFVYKNAFKMWGIWGKLGGEF